MSVPASRASEDTGAVGQYVRVGSRRTEDIAGVAFWASVAGLAGAACCGLGAIASVVAVILGHVARRSSHPGARPRRRLAGWAIALGWIGALGGTIVMFFVIDTLARSAPDIHQDDVTCFFLPCD